MTVKAGSLDRRLSILTASTTADAVGQVQHSYTASVIVWAQRLELRTADLMRAAGPNAREEVSRRAPATGKYLIRYRSDVTMSNRVTIDDISYAITAIDEPDRRTTLVLTITEAPDTVVAP